MAQCNRGGYTSFLRDDAIPVPDGADVWFRTKVRKQTYTYEYSFDGENYKEIPVTLDASILSDDYVLQSYGGFSPVHLLVWHVLIMPDTIRLQSLEVLITKSMKTN